LTTDDVIEVLGGWEGYSIEKMDVHKEGGKAQVWIELTPLPGIARRCSGCGRKVKQIHDVTFRWVRDVAILEAETWLWLGRVRVACPHCGPKVEALDWLAPYSRLTRRMAENVVRLCRVLPIKHVAEYLGLTWDTVKATDKAYLKESLGPVDLSAVEQIVMDEFAIQKGHRYATVIVEPSTKRVLWVGRGRGREDIRPFFARGSRGQLVRGQTACHLSIRNPLRIGPGRRLHRNSQAPIGRILRVPPLDRYAEDCVSLGKHAFWYHDAVILRSFCSLSGCRGGGLPRGSRGPNWTFYGTTLFGGTSRSL